ncbi:hypothetical protein ADUPG1_009552, partial [Aduncisulcus paluster]
RSDLVLRVFGEILLSGGLGICSCVILVKGSAWRVFIDLPFRSKAGICLDALDGGVFFEEVLMPSDLSNREPIYEGGIRFGRVDSTAAFSYEV